jgi:hypothetical protein
MKSADEYAFEADKRVSRTEGGSLARAQVYATLALAAATLEAARLMGPTPEDQARLDELISRKCQSVGHEVEEPHYCKCGSEMTSKAEDPSEADIDAFMGTIENPDAGLCPGCGCTANVEHADGLVCEEYPGCSALMESEPETCAYEWKNDGQHKWPTDVHPKHRCDNIKGHQIRAHICECGATGR